MLKDLVESQVVHGTLEAWSLTHSGCSTLCPTRLTLMRTETLPLTGAARRTR